MQSHIDPCSDKLTVGVDVSKHTLDVAFWQDEKSIFLGKFPNNYDGFHDIVQQIQKQILDGKRSVFVVMEPTGGYEQPFAIFAISYGWKVSLPNPQQLRDWIKGTGKRVKTDRQDALMLAMYGAIQNPPVWNPLPESVSQLESLLKRLDDFKGMLRQEENRLQSFQIQPNKHNAVEVSIRDSISFLNRQIEEIGEAIKRHYNDHPGLKQEQVNLERVSGVGIKTSSYLLVEMHRWKVLTDGKGGTKGIVAYLGLDPKHYSSGTSVHRRSGISRQGNSVIRHLLYMGALGGTRGNNPLKDFYQRLVGRGKPKKVALIAAARKIVVWCWTVFIKGEIFDPTRCYAR